MNYFRCTVGGSGKGNTVTVTCAEEFAGLTITLSKTGKTYTKTCPSTAPYVVTFNGVENGTYTVSATVSGQTYSTEVIVQDVSCVLNYGFTWKTWVDTASQLDSTDYASLSEVLADEEAVRELFLEHACVDYMAEATSINADLETIIENDLCAKWINNSDYALDFLGANTVIKALMDTADKYGYGEWVITDDTTTPATWGPKGNVPVMTANTAPYGTASATGNSANAYKVFDGNNSTDLELNGVSGGSVFYQYEFTNPICVKRVKIRNAGEAYSVLTYDLLVSNDGSNFTALTKTDSTSGLEIESEVEGEDFYKYVRVKPLTTTGKPAAGVAANTYADVVTIQFYGRSLSVSVPTMTSDTAPFGEASASDEQSGAAYKAFDGDMSASSPWMPNASVNSWIQYKFTNPVCVTKVYINPVGNSASDCRVKNFKVQGSNDGASFTDIYTGVFDSAKYSEGDYFTFNNTSYYLYYRLQVADIYPTGNYYIGVKALQFYGLDYSEKEFEAGTTKKWLYDHGVELETLSNVSSSGTVEKQDSQIVFTVPTGGSNGIKTPSINLTSYSNLFAVIGDKFVNSGAVHEVLTGDTPGSGRISYSNITNPMTYLKHNLDLSSINQSAKLMYWNGGNAQFIFSISEWWLE